MRPSRVAEPPTAPGARTSSALSRPLLLPRQQAPAQGSAQKDLQVHIHALWIFAQGTPHHVLTRVGEGRVGGKAKCGPRTQVGEHCP